MPRLKKGVVRKRRSQRPAATSRDYFAIVCGVVFHPGTRDDVRQLWKEHREHFTTEAEDRLFDERQCWAFWRFDRELSEAEAELAAYLASLVLDDEKPLDLDRIEREATGAKEGDDPRLA